MKEIPPIFVINLDSSPDRLALQERQFARMGLKFERIAAVDGRALSPELHKRYAFQWERPISHTEVACLLSHSRCWERATNFDVAVIMEDDQVLADELKPVLAALASEEGAKIFNLETQPRGKYLSKNAKANVPGVAFFDLLIATAGAGAYVVTREAAKKLLQGLERRASIADFYVHSAPGIEHLQADPALSVELSILSRMYGKRSRPEASTVITRVTHSADLRTRIYWAIQNPLTRISRAFGQIGLGLKKAWIYPVSIRRQVEPSPSIFANYDIMNAADGMKRASNG